MANNIAAALKIEKHDTMVTSGKQNYSTAEKMDNNSVAIFNSNDLMPKNADQNLPFFQNSDLRSFDILQNNKL